MLTAWWSAVVDVIDSIDQDAFAVALVCIVVVWAAFRWVER